MSQPLADAFVRVRPDTKGFAQETEQQTAGLSGSFTKLGGVIAGVFAATTIVEWGKKSVEAFLDAQESQHRLEDAFRRFPALSDTNVKALEELDAALGKKTTFDRYSIESGQAVLAQFHVTGTQLQTLTPLLLDYAAKTGQDLPSAATTLGKALQGQGRGLKAIGIQFTDTGTATGNYTELVGALRGQVGGFAEEEGRTAAGQLKILENRFLDLSVQVGSVLVPALSMLVGLVLDVTNAISGTVGWFEHNAAAAAALAAGLTTLLIPALANLISDAVQFIATNLQEAFLAAGEGVKSLVEGANAASLAMAPLTIVAAAAAYAVVRSWQSQKAAIDAGKKSADDYADSLIKSDVSVDTMAQNVGLLTTKYVENVQATVAAAKGGDILSGSFMQQFAAMQEYRAQLDASKTSMAQTATNQAALAHQYNLTTAQVETLAAVNNIKLNGSLDGAEQAFKKVFAATQATHHPLTLAQQDFKKVSDRALSATDQVNALRDAFDLLVGKSLTADEASIKFADDLADLNAALKASHHSMSLTTQAGRDARKQFDQTAQSALDLAAAQKDAGYSNTTIKRTLDAAIVSLQKAGGSNSYVKTEVDKLKAAEHGLASAVNATNAALRNVPDNPYSGVHIPKTSGLASSKYSAFGGLVTGPGTKTSDSVKMNLSAGEFVLDADTTERLGLPALNALLNGGSLPTGPTAVAPLAVSGSDGASLSALQDIARRLDVLIGVTASNPDAYASALNGTARNSAHRSRGAVPVY